MKIEEALIQLRDDLKEWVTNNLNAIGKPKASDVSIVAPEGMAATDVQGAVGELSESLANGQVKFKVENGELFYSVYTE